MKLVLIILSLLLSSNSIACSCVKSSNIVESSKWAEHVFVGKIKTDRSIEKNGWVQKYFEIEVVETVKGTPTNGYFIKPNPGVSLTNCYPQEIAVGDLYVFFVKDNQELTLHHCSSTKSIKYLEHSQPKWRSSVK